MNPENFPPLPQTGLQKTVNKMTEGTSVTTPAPIIPPNPAPTTTPTTEPETTNQFKYQKALRTYEGDVAAALAGRKVSVATIAIAENVERQKIQEQTSVTTLNVATPPVTPSKIPKNLLLLLLSLLLIGGGAYGAYYLYQQSALGTITLPDITPSKVQGIIPSSRQKEIIATSFTDTTVRERIAQERLTAQLKNGEVEELYILMNQNSVKSLIPAAQAFPLIASNVPGEVIRSLSPRLMVGLLGENGATTPFVLAKSNFFQSTFTGMLSWEEKMFRDWQPFLIDDTARFVPVATTTTTTTTTTLSRGPRFEDLTYRNKDLRVLKNDSGNIFFLYSFIDKENLIITTSLSAFDTLLKSFEKQSYVR